MLPDSMIINHKFPKNDDLTLYAVADVHLGAKECMEREFFEFIDMVKETPNAYLLLAGDLINNATKSSVSNCFDDIYRPSEQKKMMATILEPVRDRILCGTSGNHEYGRGKDVDDDPLYDIMAKLDIENLYRRNYAVVKIRIGDNQKGNGQYNPTYIFAVTHGSGGGALTGSAINKAERFGYNFDGVDCIVTAHVHKPADTTPSKLKINPFNNTVKEVPFDVVIATSWLKYSGYAGRKMYSPTSHVLQKIVLNGKKKEIEISKKHSY